MCSCVRQKILGSDFIQLVTVDCKPKVFQISRSLKTMLETNQEKKTICFKAWKTNPPTSHCLVKWIKICAGCEKLWWDKEHHLILPHASPSLAPFWKVNLIWTTILKNKYILTKDILWAQFSWFHLSNQHKVPFEPSNVSIKVFSFSQSLLLQPWE